MQKVPINKIRANPHQPRHNFHEKDLQELAASILEIGLIQAPLVRISDDGNYFELIAGERRFRAAKLAGLTEIPVIIQELNDTRSAQAALIENIQRKDLNPLEIAIALQNLIDLHQFKQQTLAQKIGKQRSTVANYLRLLSLPQNIQSSLSKDHISMGHAKAILSLSSTEKQNLLHERILREGLTVRQTEEKALQLTNKKKSTPLTKHHKRDFHKEHLENKLQEILGNKVTISGNGSKKGKIQIDFYGWEDLDRILSILAYVNKEENIESVNVPS